MLISYQLVYNFIINQTILRTMTTLTDFMTLHDRAKRVSGNAILELVFDLPEDFVQGNKFSKPILQFKFFVHKPTNLEVWINSSPGFPNIQIDESFKEHHFLRTYYELIDGSKFLPGKRNRIKFIVADATIFVDDINDITISDVVLIFQRKISA